MLILFMLAKPSLRWVGQKYFWTSENSTPPSAVSNAPKTLKCALAGHNLIERLGH